MNLINNFYLIKKKALIIKIDEGNAEILIPKGGSKKDIGDKKEKDEPVGIRNAILWVW